MFFAVELYFIWLLLKMKGHCIGCYDLITKYLWVTYSATPHFFPALCVCFVCFYRLYSDYLYFKVANKSMEDFHQKVIDSLQLFQACLLNSTLRYCVYNTDLSNAMPVSYIAFISSNCKLLCYLCNKKNRIYFCSSKIMYNLLSVSTCDINRLLTQFPF